jgi:hypothetical protein
MIYLYSLTQGVYQMINANKMLRPDAKGRVTLGKMADGISGFMVFYDEFHRIVLEPYAEIPAKEKWIFNNATILNKVKNGLSDSAAGLIKQRGTFSQYIEESN